MQLGYRNSNRFQNQEKMRKIVNTIAHLVLKWIKREIQPALPSGSWIFFPFFVCFFHVDLIIFWSITKPDRIYFNYLRFFLSLFQIYSSDSLRDIDTFNANLTVWRHNDHILFFTLFIYFLFLHPKGKKWGQVSHGWLYELINVY